MGVGVGVGAEGASCGRGGPGQQAGVIEGCSGPGDQDHGGEGGRVDHGS